MALTVDTGFVVDDAIVMLENIARYVEEGLTPLAAAYRGASEIGFTIISLTISLVAVLIPLLSGVIVSWFGFFNKDDNSGWFWEHIVARLLTSAWPGSHILGYVGTPQMQRLDASPDGMFGMDGVLYGLSLFAMPSLWIGVVAGAAMIYAAIRLRRWRDDA